MKKLKKFMSKFKINKKVANVVKETIIDWLEEIFAMLSFIVLNIAMFLINTISGLITLSAILFIIAIYVYYCKTKEYKMKGGLKIK